MPRIVHRIASALALLVVVLVALVLVARVSGQAKPTAAAKTGFCSAANGEWCNYNSDIRGSRFMPLDQINASNFSKLEVAWRIKADNFGPRPEYKLEGTPLMIKGKLYATIGARRSVVCLDPKTGQILWMHFFEEGKRFDFAPRQLSGRGLSYWTDGKGDERILYYTAGYQLFALNAKTGQPIPTFGTGGKIDLKVGIMHGRLTNGKWQQVQVDLEKAEIGCHSTPLVVGDTVVVQAAMAEAIRGEYINGAKGVTRAYDVRTGKMLWKFNNMLGPGEPGFEQAWMPIDGVSSWTWTGNTGVWTEMSADPEAGLVYLPVESPSIDQVGIHRPGTNLYSGSIVAVDLKTGKRKWHFQIVHHDIWDYDMVGAPLVMDVTIDGKPRKIVAQGSKLGWLYVFDRITGEPIWPIEERPVDISRVPGEWTSPTQPFPTKPPQFSRPFISENDLIDFTPELRKQALANLSNFDWNQKQPFTPPTGPDDKKFVGAVHVANTMGGINWPGASFDPETGIFYTQAENAQIAGTGFSREYFDFVKFETQKARNYTAIWEQKGFGEEGGIEIIGQGVSAVPAAAKAAAAEAAGQKAAAPAAAPAAAAAAKKVTLTTGLQGLPLVKPPYGVISAIDLKNGTLLFQVPHGDTPDAVRNSPIVQAVEKLSGKPFGKMGQAAIAAGFITRTLYVCGDPQVTAPPGRPRGAMLRAYDKQNGKEVGAVWMPSSQSGNPMTYMLDGRQYIIVPVGGGAYSSEYIAFTLPQAAEK